LEEAVAVQVEMEDGRRLLYQQVVTEVLVVEVEAVGVLEDLIFTLEAQDLQDKEIQEHQEVRHIQVEEEVQEHQVLQVQTQEVQEVQDHFFHNMQVPVLDFQLDGSGVVEVEVLANLG
jgi:hypothetical protein